MTDIYETKKRIEEFLEKEIDHLVPDPYAGIFHEMLDKIAEKLGIESKEEVTNGNESTDAEPTTDESSTTDIPASEERQSQSDTQPTEGTNSSTDDATATTPK